MRLPLFADLDNLPGLFVTIDGPNASGKTSIAEVVGRGLTRRATHSTKQPSPSALGEIVRRAEPNVRGRALACLIAADRHQQLEVEITPALEAGRVVVCDRYIESSLVLQRIDEVNLEYILAINSGIRRPDLRVRLDAAEEVLQGRLASRPLNEHRRFERMEGGSRRERELYAEADALLSSQYGLPALALDTSSGVAAEHAQRVLHAINERLEEQR